MPAYKTISDIPGNGQAVLVRVDVNVPMQNGQITDTTRIDRILPTIAALQENGHKIVLMSHFGRPKGRTVPEMSLRPVATKLSEMLNQDVRFIEDNLSHEAQSIVSNLPNGGICMLENLRFHPEEEANDTSFAQKLAQLGRFYVNDAFSCAHRAHASTEAIANYLPTFAGTSMDAELSALQNALETPKRPVCAVVGGAKISTKLELINNLAEKVDMIILGGGMANTFLKAQGHDIGQSLCEDDMLDTAKDVLASATAKNCEIILPIDGSLSTAFKENAPFTNRPCNEIKHDEMMLDVGSESITFFIDKLKDVKTVLWNGPLGAFEIEPFDSGTIALAQHVAKAVSAGQLIAVAGGGDTVAALAKAGVINEMTYVSTAGGAFLEWLEGKTLPAVASLHQHGKAA